MKKKSPYVAFFKLDSSETITLISSVEEFVSKFENSDSTYNLKMNAQTITDITISGKKNKLKNKVMNHMDLSRNTFQRIEFHDCTFERVLLIGTKFMNCKFFNCKFIDCNVWKMTIDSCYIDPKDFKYCIRNTAYSNFAVTLFQGLYKNSEKMSQKEFAEFADYYFKKWQRKQFKFDLKRNKIKRLEYLYKFLKNYIYHYTMGYGYKPSYFMGSSIIFFILVNIHNFCKWESLEINKGTELICNPKFLDVVYYSYLSMTSMSGIYTPQSEYGIVTSIIQSFLGVLWIGILIAIITKNIFK